MKTLISFLLISMLLIISTISSCNKDCCPGSPAPPLIKTYQYIDSSSGINITQYFYYDNQSRLIQINQSSDTTKFEYSDHQILVKRIQSGIESLSSTYFLNSNKMVDSVANSQSFLKYTYDDSLYFLHKEIFYDKNNKTSIIRNYTIQNMNLVNQIRYDLNSKDTSVYTYSNFDPDHGSTIEPSNHGQAYFGRTTNHVAGKISVFYKSTGKTSDSYYTFNYDSLGRISTIITTYDINKSYVEKYTYY